MCSNSDCMLDSKDDTLQTLGFVFFSAVLNYWKTILTLVLHGVRVGLFGFALSPRMWSLLLRHGPFEVSMQCPRYLAIPSNMAGLDSNSKV